MKQFGSGLSGFERAGMCVVGLVLALALLASPGFAGAAVEGRVDLNTATVEELSSLPGVGAARARAILERRANGGFQATEDLMEVPGIGAVLFERLRDHVVVGDAGEGGATETLP